jgi:hypothetical protein
MRYYHVQITDPSSGKVLKDYNSYVNGQTDPGALNVELDIQVAPYDAPVGGSYVRVWGIPLTDIGQAADLNGKNIAVYGGMQKGLPLANPAQAGLLVSGTIFQAFGNWQDVDMTLDLILLASGPGSDAPSASAPVNLTQNWKAGTPLSAAIKTTLGTAFPSTKSTINIDPSLILAHDEPGFYGNLAQFAKYIKDVSQSIKGGTYPGVSITIQDAAFVVYDGTSKSSPKQIAFNDLIGQVTWKAPNIVNFTCVMRADFHVGDYVKLPPGQVTTTAQSLSQYRQGSVFNGTFQIVYVRHVGNYRADDGRYWATIYDATLQAPGT